MTSLHIAYKDAADKLGKETCPRFREPLTILDTVNNKTILLN